MSRESRLSFKNQGALPQTLQALVWSELCFAKWSATAASWSKHFATQNGLRPPRFLRGAYFAVHWFNLNFIKIILANDFLDNITFKFCINLNSRHFQNCVKTEQYSCEDFMVMTFALQNCRLAESILYHFRTIDRKSVGRERV